MGAWINYGLGSENQDLPGYVVIDEGLIPPSGLGNFNSGFLPTTFQGPIFRGRDMPLPNIEPHRLTSDLQRRNRNLMSQTDQICLDALVIMIT
ncbi:MAG: DUF1501 domain-containing protein [Bacteroidetes bacterium]|nr:DUF1501 domain-containing protein [Bacteroidota bacterium]